MIPGQKRVHLHIVESGMGRISRTPSSERASSSSCRTICRSRRRWKSRLHYDEQARVHVEARDVTSGAVAMAVIVREENRTFLTPDQAQAAEVALRPAAAVAAGEARACAVLRPSPWSTFVPPVGRCKAARQRQCGRLPKAADGQSDDEAPARMRRRCWNARSGRFRCATTAASR